MNAKNNTLITLCRPQLPENIGAAARAISVMGFERLALIAPQCDPLDSKAFQLASHAAPLLEQSQSFAHVKDLVDADTFLVGFSARERTYDLEQCFLTDLPSRIQATSKKKIVLLFGAERTGLTNEELSYCHLQCMIPTFNPNYGSLNLAQAVQIVTYTLAVAQQKIDDLDDRKGAGNPIAPAQNNEKLTQAFYDYIEGLAQQDVLHDFCQRTTLEKTLLRLRLLFNRIVQNEDDVHFLFGFFKSLTKGMR